MSIFFCTFYKSSTASIIGIFLVFLKGTLPESWLAWFLFKDWLCSVQDWLCSVYFHSSGGGGRRLLRRSSSRGLDTLELKTASVPAPAFTANKMASSNLQIRGEKHPSDRPEPAQIARDRSLKQTKSKYNTREISDVRIVPLPDHITQVSRSNI